MKVLVTGGTGNVGRAAVARLVQHGHQVRVIGRRTGIEIDGAEYRSCDITDFDALREQVKGMEAVVHLAAIPSPAGGPGQEIFRINCAGTFNVYRTAADEGIGRIVTASSINALGYNYGIKNFDLCYFPIDEEHPTFTTDPYSFSKQVLEGIAAYFWRREGISSVCLRLPAVYELSDERQNRFREFVSRFKTAFQELMDLPVEEQRERVQHAIDEFNASRLERARPMSREEMRERWRTRARDPGMILIFGAFGRSNFWTSIDAEDSAQAIEKGLLAEYSGSHPLYVNDSENAAGVASEQLVSIFFPTVSARKHPLQGTESLVSIEKAGTLIGFEPEHSISQWFQIGST